MGGFDLGRVFGIRISVQWSLFFIVWLVTFNLAVGLFPAWHPEWSAALTWGVALLASVLLFASILAHELSHALVGRAVGVQVSSITLFIFGGAANIDKEPESPRAEFLMAVVGPVASLVIGVASLFVGTALANGREGEDAIQALRRVGPAATLLLWLGPVNIILAVFNLLPGFPLDGGRVLRALLWKGTGDFVRATRWASRVGQGFAWALILAGVLMIYGIQIPVLGVGLIQGLWLIFIGWFLNSAAQASFSQVVVRDLLEGLPVTSLMRRDVPTVTPDTTLDRLVDEFLLRTDSHSFPVVSGDALLGVVSLPDVRRVPRARWSTTRVGEVMTPAATLTTATPGEDAFQALRDLGRRDVAQLPVVQDGHLVGTISRADILKWLELQTTGARQAHRV